MKTAAPGSCNGIIGRPVQTKVHAGMPPSPSRIDFSLPCAMLPRNHTPAVPRRRQANGLRRAARRRMP